MRMYVLNRSLGVLLCIVHIFCFQKCSARQLQRLKFAYICVGCEGICMHAWWVRDWTLSVPFLFRNLTAKLARRVWDQKWLFLPVGSLWRDTHRLCNWIRKGCFWWLKQFFPTHYNSVTPISVSNV